YTPQKSDGSVSISKAIQINQQFQESLQFWTYLVEQGKITCPHEFITLVMNSCGQVIFPCSTRYVQNCRFRNRCSSGRIWLSRGRLPAHTSSSPRCLTLASLRRTRASASCASAMRR